MSENLIVPIYVDTNALLDLLASIEGGFSVVEKVTTRNANTKELDRSVQAGTEFGVPNILNMLKVNIGYASNWKKGEEAGQETEAERYHTYGSLLFRLRAYLQAENTIKQFDGANEEVWTSIQPSDFIEIRGIFRPNPLAASLRVIDRLIGIFEMLYTPPSTQAQPASQPHSNKPRSKRKKQKPKASDNKSPSTDTSQLNQIQGLIQNILTDIEREQIRTFVVDLPLATSHKAIALLFVDYLRDKTMVEISHREYRLFGKVVRKLDSDTEESIDLLRGTGLGGIGKEPLQQLVGAFDQMEGMNLPEVSTEIAGPALEIVPIAVFV